MLPLTFGQLGAGTPRCKVEGRSIHLWKQPILDETEETTDAEKEKEKSNYPNKLLKLG